MIKRTISKMQILKIQAFAYTLSLISGKHKMVILYCLMEFETVRFNELKTVSENYFPTKRSVPISKSWRKTA